MDVSRRRALALIGSVAAVWAKGDDPLSGFEAFPTPRGYLGKKVYRIGSGPPVLFLHELPGLLREAILLVRRLSDRGFTVYMPLLFGKPGENSTARVVLRTPCWGKAFDCASQTSLGTIVQWTAGLVTEIDQRSGNRGVGVIGNCLTGAVPLALMADKTIQKRLKCCVIAQPAVPMGLFGAPRSRAARIALGLTDDQLKEAVNSNVPALALRINGDRLVPEERLLALAKRFEGRPFEFYPVSPDERCHQGRDHSSGHQHASLTLAYCEDPESNGRRAYEKVVGFLERSLRREP